MLLEVEQSCSKREIQPLQAGMCDHSRMSLFRKRPPTTAPTPVPTVVDAAPVQAPSSSPPAQLFDGATIDLGAIYRTGQLTGDELDRVTRAEGLLHLLPSKAANTREIVDATFHAFGVDRNRIVDAASKQLDALERFIRFSQDQTQRVLDVGAQRIAELEAEIGRFRQAAAQATHEGEERARAVNTEMVKVQRVLDFFGGDSEPSTAEIGLDDATGVNRHGVDITSSAVKPSSGASHSTPGSKPTQRPTS